MDWVPRFVFGTTTLNLTLPQQPWRRRMSVVGGHRVLASGIPVGRTIRRDRILDIALRVLETELAAVDTMVAWMQDNPGTAFIFRPDKEVNTDYSSYLVQPVGEVEYEPVRDERYGDLHIAGLSIRRPTGVGWPMIYFLDADV